MLGKAFTWVRLQFCRGYQPVSHCRVHGQVWLGINLACLISFLNTIHKLVFQHRNQNGWACFAISRSGYWRRYRSFYFVNNTKHVKKEFFITLLVTLVQIFCFFCDPLFNEIKIKKSSISCIPFCPTASACLDFLSTMWMLTRTAYWISLESSHALPFCLTSASIQLFTWTILYSFYFYNIMLRTDLLACGVAGVVFRVAGEMRRLPAYFDNPARSCRQLGRSCNY